MLDFQAARYLMDRDIATQAGNNHATISPTGVFETSDGYVNIAVVGEQIWQRFARALDRLDWLDNDGYNTDADAALTPMI